MLDVNPANCALYGRRADEFVGKNIATLSGVEDQETAASFYQASFTAAEPPPSFEARIRRPDGSERVVEVRVDFLIRDGQRVAMVSEIRDITERERLDQA